MSFRPPPTGPPAPRAASPNPLIWPAALGLSVLLACVPVTLPLTVVAALVLRWRNWSPRKVLAIALPLLPALLWLLRGQLGSQVLQVVELAKEVRAGSVLWLHLSSLPDWLLAVPLAFTLAALSALGAERRDAGAEWSPAVQRSRVRKARTDTRKVGRVTARTSGAAKVPRIRELHDARCETPAIAVAYADGDLRGWTVHPSALPLGRARLVVPPGNLRGLSMGVFGIPGSGKTVTLEQFVSLAAAQGRKVIFVDCKGTDPNLEATITAAFAEGFGEPFRVLSWPEEPLSVWRGHPQHVANRLISASEFSEPWYRYAAVGGLRLAVTAPGFEPVTSSRELFRRLSQSWLSEAWAGHPEELGLVSDIGEYLAGVRLRYAAQLGAVGDSLDGSVSFEDVDLSFLRVPVLATPEDADAAMRLLVADVAHYATVRKPRTGEDVLLVLDEFSAITGLARQVTGLVERLRDVGVQVVVAAQSVEGLGEDEREALRLLGALGGGLVVHQMPNPSLLVEMAGTVREPEQSWQLDEYGSSGMGSVRMGFRAKVPPDMVRAFVPGEAVIIHGGAYLHVRMLPSREVKGRPPVPVEELAVHVSETPAWVEELEAELARLAVLGKPGPLALEAPERPDRELPDPTLPRLQRSLSAAVRARNGQKAMEVQAAGRELAPSWDSASELGQLRTYWRTVRHPVLAALVRLVLRAWRAAVHSTPREVSR